MKYHRKVIRITAEMSPNVILGLAQRAKGREPTGEVIIPGVLPWNDYVKRRATWDKVKQTVSLDALFYEGSELLMYPPDWIDRAERIGLGYELGDGQVKRTRASRGARAIGCDPAEGGDSSCWSVVDEYGLCELVTMKTPDTNVIPAVTISLMGRWRVNPRNVVFDRGGGGKEHADRLRALGYPVWTMAFGESVSPDPRATSPGLRQKVDEREDRYAYKNRRAEVYDRLRQFLDPARGMAGPGGRLEGVPVKVCSRDGAAPEDVRMTGWGLVPSSSGPQYAELRRQMAPIPLTYDGEQRLYLLPKNKPTPTHTGQTLSSLLGRSPDELDSLVLALHGMCGRPPRPVGGAS